MAGDFGKLGVSGRGRGLIPRPRNVRREGLIEFALASCTGITVLVMALMVAVLLGETVAFFTEVSPWEFFTEARWTPLFREKHFGILPLLSGSGLVVVGAGAIAIPLGLLTAIYLSEFASSRGRGVIKPVVEALAGLPTVVFGYFALTLISPVMQRVFPSAGAFNALSASLALGLMIVPTVASLSEEALRGVPSSVREGAFALGAGRLETILRVVLPGALPGILASFVLALSRALGETMVVAMAAGGSPNFTLNPLDAVQTLTAYLLQAGQGNVMAGTLDYRTFFAVGMTLFIHLSCS